MRSIAPEVRDELGAQARARFGLVFPESRARSLDEAIARAAEDLGERDPWRLRDRVVRGDPDAVRAFSSAVTVGETYFFRDAGHFELLRERLRALAARRDGRAIRLWSAGCATGEEAYSMAVVAHETFGERFSERVTVLATDLNPAFLTQAREGVYRAWSFRAAASLRDRWFAPHGNAWRIAPALRRAVTFALFNLQDVLSPSAPRGFDVVFCRNVLIYFDRDTTARVARGFARALFDDGVLVTGPSDPLLPPDSGLVAQPTPAGLTWRRAWAEAPVEPPRVLPPPPAALNDLRAPEPRAARPRSASRPRPSEPPRERERPPSPDLPVRARALADAGQLTEAAHLLDRAIESDALCVELYILRATVRLGLGDPRGAAEDAARALLLDREAAFAHVLAATAAFETGDLRAGERHQRNARRALLQKPGDAVVPFAGAVTHGEMLYVCDRLARGRWGGA